MKYIHGSLVFVLKHKGIIVDDMIKLISGGRAAHVAGLIDENTIFEMHCPKGAITRPLSDYAGNKYVIMIAEPMFLNYAQQMSIARYLKNMDGKYKYDYKGIAGQLLRIPDRFNDVERYYCSEAIGEAYDECVAYRFKGIAPKEQTPGDQAYDCIARQTFGWKISFME